MVRKKIMAVALTIATLLPMGAGATTLNPGDVVNMVGSYDFTKTFTGADTAGIYKFTFVNNNTTNSNVIVSEATVQALNLAFGAVTTNPLTNGAPGVVFSWASTGTFFSTKTTGSVADFMHTIAANAIDVLTITFGDPTVRKNKPLDSTGTITLSTSATPVPLPAGGLLLIGALGGLTVLRRRKSV